MSDRDPLSYRPAELLMSLLGYVHDAEGDVPVDELIEYHSNEDRPFRTVDAALRDLVAYGALHVVGRRPGRSAGAVRVTPLGRCWIDREPLPPLPGTEAS